MLHTGFISFCDRINSNIKSSDAKTKILAELEYFNVSVLQKHWHHYDERGQEQVKRSPHFACLRSNGNPYYMYFGRQDDVCTIYYIDKKVHPGYQQPRIILARGMFDESLFDGTVLDGEMVKTRSGQWVFLINDCIVYKGERLKTMLPQRLEIIYDILGSMYFPDTHMDVCKFQVKRYMKVSPTSQQDLQDYASTLPYTCRGIYYWPHNNMYKPKLYNFDASVIQPVIRKVKDVPDFREKSVHRISSSSSSSSIHNTAGGGDTAGGNTTTTPACIDTDGVKWLRKTDLPDVYNVFDSDSLQAKPLGSAVVSSMSTSKMLRAVFKDATVMQQFPFKCVLQPSGKWLPMAPA